VFPPFPAVDLPLEIQLLVLYHCISTSIPIPVCVVPDPCLASESWPYHYNRQVFSILPFPILQTCRFYRDEGFKLLYKYNTFLFTTPNIISADYSRDWYYPLTNWAPKTTVVALSSMRHVRFESDRPVGEELVHMALKNFECIQTLEVDLVGIWSQEQHWHPREAEELIDVIWNIMDITTVGRNLRSIRFAGMQYDRSDWEHVILHVERLTGALGRVESHRQVEKERLKMQPKGLRAWIYAVTRLLFRKGTPFKLSRMTAVQDFRSSSIKVSKRLVLGLEH
jgi:hypothetical protein